eukprot:726630_1
MMSASRSDSRQKWLILGCISTLAVASYFCILCPSALEDHMIETYHLSNTEFALFATISFGFAIIGSLVTPYALKYLSIYNTMLLSCVCMVIGQVTFIIGMTFYDHTHIYLMYVGRIYIGVGYGIQNVLIFSTIHVWFENSTWLSVAMNILNGTFEGGQLVTRYGMEPLFAYTNQLWMPYWIGVVLAFISMACCVLMTSIDKSFNSSLSIASLLGDDYAQMKYLNTNTWLAMVIVIIVWSNAEIVGTQFTNPLIAEFGVNEWQADILLSGSAVYALSIGQIVGVVITKYGYFSYCLCASVFLMTLSLTVMCLYDITWPISPLVAAWAVIIVYT